MPEKLLEKIYKIILNRIVDKIPEPSFKVPIDFSLRDAILAKSNKRIAELLFSRYSRIELSKSFEEKSYIIDEYMRVHEISARTIDEAIRKIDKLGISIVNSLVRIWPTIPPHLLSSDLLLATEINARSLAVASRRGDEVHLLLMKGDWEKCMNIREKVSLKIFENADEIVPLVTNIREEIESFDAFNYGGNFIKLYPNIINEVKWHDAVNYLTRKYLGPIEFPQYILFRLI